MAFRTDSILQMAMYIEVLYIHSMEWYRQYLITIQGNQFTIDDDLWNRFLSLTMMTFGTDIFQVMAAVSYKRSSNTSSTIHSRKSIHH